ncbi:hypothetical protein [Limnoglobus roseus]|uniref:hypothetical protein n=1 Tax=Limnoglobus roseus TaxID=2598579 RepID=UPI0011EB2EDF|nr:hypothetical protein [Limnoglobus roseus]
MRPGDVCKLRPVEIDRTAEVWLYEPRWHKGTHRGKRRVVPIGPRGRAILEPLLAACAEPNAYLFSAAASAAEFREMRAANRKTPLWPSAVARNVRERKADPKRKPADRYTNVSYGRAILKVVARACQWREKMAAGGVFGSVPARTLSGTSRSRQGYPQGTHRGGEFGRLQPGRGADPHQE